MQLLQQLFFDLLIQMEGKDLLLIFKELGIFVFSQLLLDDAKLFPKIIILLILIHGCLNLLSNIPLDLHDLDLGVQDLHRQLKPLNRMPLFQTPLLIIVPESAVLPHKIRHPCGILIGHQLQQILCAALGQQVAVNAVKLEGHTEQRFHLGSSGTVALVGQGFTDTLQIGAFLGIFRHENAADALHKHPGNITGHFQNLTDMYQNTDLIEVVGAGLIHRNILLHQKDHLLIAVHCHIQGTNRLLPAHIKRINHSREHSQSPEGHDGR